MSAPTCDYDGCFKVIREHGGMPTSLYCSGHAHDWKRLLGGRIVEPRNLDGKTLPCQGDWLLPGMIP